jgi:hypothetical protein
MGDWTGIPGIIQPRRISPPDPQVFAGLDFTAVDKRREPGAVAVVAVGTCTPGRIS